MAALFGQTAEKVIANAFATEARSAFFWSGRTGSAGGADLAASIAKKSNGTTLEMLLAERKIAMPAWDASNPAVVKAWQEASAQYAQGHLVLCGR
jgi:filamentous hemagglutinin